MYHVTKSIIGSIATILGFTISLAAIDTALRITGGAVAIIAGIYTIIYTHLKIKDIKNKG